MGEAKQGDALIKDGFKPKDAVAVTAALLDKIARRCKDDPAFKTAPGWINSGELRKCRISDKLKLAIVSSQQSIFIPQHD